MATDLTQKPASRIVDLTGLPESVVQKVTEFIEEARQQQTKDASTASRLPSVVGMFDHLGIKTPTVGELDEARREMWANFPRNI
jgi:hypothetical protein